MKMCTQFSPSCPLRVSLRSGGTCRLHLQDLNAWKALSADCFMLVSSLVSLQPWRWRQHVSLNRGLTAPLTTWRYIPEDRPLHNHGSENLKSQIPYLIFFLGEGSHFRYCTSVSALEKRWKAQSIKSFPPSASTSITEQTELRNYFCSYRETSLPILRTLHITADHRNTDAHPCLGQSPNPESQIFEP
jgi:hypothetical protein